MLEHLLRKKDRLEGVIRTRSNNKTKQFLIITSICVNVIYVYTPSIYNSW